MDEAGALQLANDIVRASKTLPDIDIIHKIRDALLKAKKDAIDRCIAQAMVSRWWCREELLGYARVPAAPTPDELRDWVQFALSDLIADMHNEASIRVGDGGKVFDLDRDGPDFEDGRDTLETAIIAGMDRAEVWS